MPNYFGITCRIRRNTHIATSRTGDVSWIAILYPITYAYLDGFQSRKQFWPEEKSNEAKTRDLGYATAPLTALTFTGSLAITPNLARNGRVRKRATPDDLKDVHAVLKVGSQVYQPKDQPGDLKYAEDVREGTVREFHADYSQSSGQASAYDSRGQYAGSATATGSTTNYFTVTSHTEYEVYTGKFEITFDLFNADGTPRITAADKTFEVVIVYGNNEKHVRFDLGRMARECASK